MATIQSTKPALISGTMAEQPSPAGVSAPDRLIPMVTSGSSIFCVKSWQPSRKHSASLVLFGALPYYRGWSRYGGSSDFANGNDRLPAVRRRDAQMGGQASYAFRGPVAVQAGYAYTRISSTSYGEASERHRRWAAASTKLPWRLYGSLQAAWQFIRYPDVGTTDPAYPM